jgi:hypothetical protein
MPRRPPSPLTQKRGLSQADESAHPLGLRYHRDIELPHSPWHTKAPEIVVARRGREAGVHTFKRR